MIDVFEAFAGYGGGSFSLSKAKISHRVIGYSEIDKYASQCFDQNHGDVPAYGDITKIDWKKVPDFDLLTGGFPCTDISIAGKQDLKRGRSTLVFELIKALEVKQPKYFLFENVAAIEHQNFRAFLFLVENELRKANYKVYRKTLNSKNFGVPHNRERTWFIGYRKDIAPAFGFTPYPKEVPLTKFLIDLLENGVVDRDISYCIDANYWKGTNYQHYMDKKVRQIVFKLPSNTKKGYSLAINGDGVRLQFPKSQTARGRVLKKIAQTIQANSVGGVVQNDQIRKLTPTECFRLMGFQDNEINLDGISNRQKYRLAGNGWEINLVSKIFKGMGISELGYDVKKDVKR